VLSLAACMQDRLKAKEPRFVLILGSGASLTSGAASMRGVVEEVLQRHTGLEPGMPWEQALDEFYKILGGLCKTDRYVVLKPLLESKQHSLGYVRLAEIMKAGYYDVIFTTNVDTFLEDSLVDAGLRDFAVLVIGRDTVSSILETVNFSSPRIKIVKLHGCLRARILKFTPAEVFEFSGQLEAELSKILARDKVVVGHSLNDIDLQRCIGHNGDLWYVNPSEPSVTTFAGMAVQAGTMAS
jgi:hypothetical protein